MNRTNRPKVAIWFRYGSAEHTELLPALPAIIAQLGRHAEVHYYGMKSKKTVPDIISRNAHLHYLPFYCNRSCQRDKVIKSVLWIMLLPLVALHCRLMRVKAVFIDETIPITVPIARLFFGANTACTVADMFMEIYGRKSPLIRALGRWAGKCDVAAWRNVALILTKTRSAREFLINQGIAENRIRTIYDPCDFAVYRPLPANEKKTVRREFNIADQDIVLVHHGILHPNKGNDLIISALADLADTYPRLRYLLIGDGAEMENIKGLVDKLNMQERVIMTGWLPTPDDVNRALNAGDIALAMRTGHNSDHFHLTSALVHGMAGGLPVLAARLDGIRELIRDDENGLLFNPADMQDFKRQLVRLLDDNELRARLGRQALTDARVHFDITGVAEQTAQALCALL